MAISEEELRIIEARIEAATAGPWQCYIEGRDHWGGDDLIRTGGMDDASPDMYVTLSYGNDDPPSPAKANDLDFIASARQDLPALVAEIRRLNPRH